MDLGYVPLLSPSPDFQRSPKEEKTKSTKEENDGPRKEIHQLLRSPDLSSKITFFCRVMRNLNQFGILLNLGPLISLEPKLVTRALPICKLMDRMTLTRIIHTLPLLYAGGILYTPSFTTSY